jgi:GAF domain
MDGLMDRQVMDHYSILDRSSASPGVEGGMPDTSASRPAIASVSAGIAAANAHPPNPAQPGPRFSGEDGGRSLAEMASSDLDAALQLLVERAQYITTASGAAIALRRGQHNDMLCRASTGSNAPELGALLSMEYGLSGECVRTRQPLRCDDAERDPRVNHEVCRQLGIASVVVMPVVSEEQVLGVFELFSGKPRAFDERDLSALQRLSEIVETAVKHAMATQTLPAIQEPAAAERQPFGDGIATAAVPVESPVSVIGPDLAPAKDPPPPEPERPEPQETELEKRKPAPVPPKPLFWSAVMQAQASTAQADESTAPIAVPPVLRNLQKCQACGFPVSQGRTFCVECEEKQWRGQRLPQPQTAPTPQTSEPARGKVAASAPAVALAATPRNLTSAPTRVEAIAAQTSVPSSSHFPDVAADVPGSDDSALFLSSAMPSESWLAANKYILGTLLVVAIVIGAIAWLR